MQRERVYEMDQNAAVVGWGGPDDLEGACFTGSTLPSRTALSSNLLVEIKTHKPQHPFALSQAQVGCLNA